MSPTVPARERELAAELELRLGRDAELATRPGDAQQQRLPGIDERLWMVPYCDGIATIHGEHRAAVKIAVARNRSVILDVPDPLRDAERAQWTIHRALIDYQQTAERRRQLASDVGEPAGALIATLVEAGGSDNDGGGASVNELADARGTGGSGS